MLSILKLLAGETGDDDEDRADPYAPRNDLYPARPARPRRSMIEAGPWDEYWVNQLTSGAAAFVDMFCDDGALVDAMRANKLKTVLCAGNGISQEPRALALAGFDVTALDISPLAIRMATELRPPKKLLRQLLGGRPARRGGRVRFVTGDLRDMTVCPGPFDVVLERRTLQLYSDEDRPAAMQALAARLASPGIFFSHSHRNPTPSGMRQDSYPADWFNAERWPRWQPRTPLTGRTAWLLSSSG